MVTRPWVLITVFAATLNVFAFTSSHAKASGDENVGFEEAWQGSSRPIVTGFDSHKQNRFSADAKVAGFTRLTGWLETAASESTLGTGSEGRRYNLLRWLSVQLKKSRATAAPDVPKYNRIFHFGTWINEDAPTDCYNTRAEVLIRDHDPSGALKFQKSNPCSVARGLWYDPYTGRNFKMSETMQIDHVVPLQNAYYSGAWKWNFHRRCHYANFIGNNYHLLTVKGHENMSKAERDPSRYLPPRKKYWCEYVKIWMKIKLVWDLSVTEDEVAGIQGALRAAKCDPDDQIIGEDELREMRRASQQVTGRCLQSQPPQVKPPHQQQKLFSPDAFESYDASLPAEPQIRYMSRVAEREP